MKRNYTSIDLAELRQLKIRDIWPTEDKHFTPWLMDADNLRILSDAIGISLEPLETESKVGAFSADILAQTQDAEQLVIIENQFNDTDHDHLGKLITYASGKDADVVIWIVEKARDEHRKAIEWLNQRTDETLGFFLVELQVWQIGDSKPAAQFQVVESPNNWGKLAKKELSTGAETRLLFWNQFRDCASQTEGFSFNLPKPLPQSWYNLSIGSSRYHLRLKVIEREVHAALYIDIRKGKDVYETLLQEASSIEQEIGEELIWSEHQVSCIIEAKYAKGLKTQSDWNDAFRWLMETALKMRASFKSRL